MRCPVCDSREVGKIGEREYYCWCCNVEFNDNNKVFSIDIKGRLKEVLK